MGRGLVLCAVVAVLVSAGCKKGSSGPDLSTPKSAALTFTTALERGDSATARLASNAGGIEQDLVDAMAQSASGIKRLDAAASAKFGEDAKRLVSMRGSSAVTTNLKDGDVEQNAERATVRSKDGKDSIQLQCTDGQWRVDIGALIRGQDVVRVVPVFRAAGIAARKVADDIDSGKCKSVDEAKQAMSAQIGAALPELVRKELSPSTAPAPSPAIDSFDNLAK